MKFVTVDGIDGSGKSSLITRFTCNMHDRTNVFRLKQPSLFGPGSEIYAMAKKGLRMDPEKEYATLMEDRRYVMNMVRTANICENAEFLLMDRHFFSMAAYQSFKSDKTPEQIIEENVKLFGWPTISIILDVPVDVAVSRIKKSRGDDADIFDRDMELLTHCAEVFKNIEYPSDKHVYHIDASREIDEVYADFEKILLT